MHAERALHFEGHCFCVTFPKVFRVLRTVLFTFTGVDVMVLSFDPLTMCLPSGEYATERTQSECPVSVHSCSWTKHARQHQCTQQQMIQHVKTP